MPNEPISTGLISTTDADKIVGRLNDNFGHIGMSYSQWLGANFLTIEKEVEDIRKMVEEETGARNEERFWTGSVAAIIAGARFAVRLGYITINERELKAFLYNTIDNMRKITKVSRNDMTDSKNVEAVLSQYFQAMRYRHTLYTNRVHTARGAPARNSIKILRDASRIEDVRIHIGVENGVIRFTSNDFSDWLQSRGLNRKAFMDAMEKVYHQKEFAARIAAGTDFAPPQSQILIEINAVGTPLAEFFTADEEAA